MRSAPAFAAMKALDFDVAPLDEAPVNRYVLRSELTSPDEPVRRFAHTITAKDVIADSMPLADAIERLRSRAWLFVVGPESVSRMLTWADLQNPTLSVTTLGLITMIEHGFDRLIERTLGEAMLDPLTEERRARIRELCEKRRAQNIELPLVTNLNLDDRCRIVAKSEAIRSTLGSRRGAPSTSA